MSAPADAIDRVLPQTQCTRCGYPACRPYAEAVASGTAPINRCPPGGDAGVRALAALTGRAYLPLDPTCGPARPLHQALIDEAHCIGCTLCIQACPVDAIAGAPKRMHTVIASLCTGCDLCVAPCPVDCIAMVPATGPDALWDAGRADAARARYLARKARLAQEAAERADRLARRAAALRDAPTPEAKRAAIDAALARARARRAAFARRGTR
jgi:electron transport complex protein RnfB